MHLRVMVCKGKGKGKELELVAQGLCKCISSTNIGNWLEHQGGIREPVKNVLADFVR